MKKPDCYECEHRKKVSGSAHSSCGKPESIGGNPFEFIIPAQMNAVPGIKFDKHGIREGWAMWPVNFDPVWLVECEYFKNNI